MKRLSTMLMLLALAVPAVHTYAHQLTPTQAIERVAGSKRTLCLKAPATRNASASAQAEVVPALTVADPATGQPGIYAIRGAAPTGGILFLAADDAAAVSVIGYTDADDGRTGALTLADLLADLLRAAAHKVGLAARDEQAHPAAAALRKAATATSATPTHVLLTAPFTQTTAISSLCSSTWTQRSPYNEKCLSVDNTHSRVGCVATALSQIMYKHKWPCQNGTTGHGVGTAKNTKGTTASQVTTVTTVDLSNITFNWNNIKNSSSGTNDDVANLCYAVGMACAMKYGSNSSSTDIGAVPNALATNFGYSSDVRLYYLEYYPLDYIKNRIYENLKAGQPCLMAGKYEEDGTAHGHAFVLDGFQHTSGSDKWHFNFGWPTTSYNGYFTLDNIHPGGGTTDTSVEDMGNYELQQRIVLDIKPDKSNSDPAQVRDETKFLAPANAVFNYRSSVAQTQRGPAGALVFNVVDTLSSKYMRISFTNLHISPNYTTTNLTSVNHAVYFGALVEGSNGGQHWSDGYYDNSGTFDKVSITGGNGSSLSSKLAKYCGISSVSPGVYSIYPAQRSDSKSDYRYVPNIYGYPQCVVAKVSASGDWSFKYPEDKAFSVDVTNGFTHTDGLLWHNTDKYLDASYNAATDSTTFILRFKAGYSSSDASATYDSGEDVAQEDVLDAATAGGATTSSDLYTQVAAGVFDLQNGQLVPVALGRWVPLVLEDGADEQLVRLTNYRLKIDDTDTWPATYRVALYNQAGTVLAGPYTKSETIHTGIDTIGADEPATDADAPAQYFNLQGQLMARPLAPGIYICRQGAHASKVVVR